MDWFTGTPFLILLAILAGIFVVWLGFNLQPPAKRPNLPGNEPAQSPAIPVELPETVSKYLNKIYSGATPGAPTCVAWGNGKIVVGHAPVIGAIWAPMSWIMYLIPGEAFVWRTRITWLGRTILNGGDEYLQEHGRFKMGNTAVENNNIDRSEKTMLWIYSLLFSPAFLLFTEKIIWKSDGNDKVRLRVKGNPARPFEFDLDFHPTTHELQQIRTNRTASKDGKEFPFKVQLSHLVNFPGVGNLPSQISSAWENDYYIRLKIVGLAYNLNIESVIKEGV